MTDEKFTKVISDLEAAADGASMKIAIINALTDLNNDGGNAMTFDGKYVDFYLFKDDFNANLRNLSLMLDSLDDNPKENSPSLVPSGNTKYYLDSIITRFKSINGGDNSKKENANNVATQLKILNVLKGQIRDAINSVIPDPNKRIDDELDSFEDYAKRLKEGIEVAYQFEETTITSNGKHTPEQGKLWNIVNVNVQPRVGMKVIRSYGKQSIESDPNLDAWNPVIVEVPGAPRGNSGSSYNPSSSGSHKKEDTQLNLDDLSVTKNGLYSATEGKDAIGSINVNVTEIDPDILSLMKFSVEWQNYDGTNLDAQDNITGGSAVYYTGDIPKKETDDGSIWTFSHFDQPTDYVDHDIVTKAVFTEAKYSEDDGQRSWEDIISNGVGKNDIGMHKVLNLLPYTGATTDVKFGPIMMRLVDIGEGGQVWLSENLLSWAHIWRSCSSSKWVSPNPVSGWFVTDVAGRGYDVTGDLANAATKLGWANSPLRVWLETEFPKCLPPMVRDALTTVNKTYYTIMSTDTNNHDVANAWSLAAGGGYTGGISKYAIGGVSDGTNSIKTKVWIPSVREICGSYFKNKPSENAMQVGSKNRTLGVEYSGPIYSAFDNYSEINVTDWANDRAKAIKDIYFNAGRYFALKHRFHYPYKESTVEWAPHFLWHLNGGYSSPIQYFDYSWWPTRTTVGSLMHINHFGNSKNDVRNAANEHIADPNCNLAKSAGDNPYGICFGFVLS